MSYRPLGSRPPQELSAPREANRVWEQKIPPFSRLTSLQQREAIQRTDPDNPTRTDGRGLAMGDSRHQFPLEDLQMEKSTRRDVLTVTGAAGVAAGIGMLIKQEVGGPIRKALAAEDLRHSREVTHLCSARPTHLQEN